MARVEPFDGALDASRVSRSNNSLAFSSIAWIDGSAMKKFVVGWLMACFIARVVLPLPVTPMT